MIKTFLKDVIILGEFLIYASKRYILLFTLFFVFYFCMFLAMLTFSKGYDTEIWNGYIIDKYSERVTCEHKYKCGENCSTDSKGNQSCTPIYCKRHSYDIDWIIKSNYNKKVYIKRIDSQGVKQPLRFTLAKINDQFSSSHNYMNYILYNTNGLFYPERPSMINKYQIPKYPIIFDYYKINRVINDSSSFKDEEKLNNIVSDRLKYLGTDKQVNIIYVLTNNNVDWYYHLIYNWRGGKKNDVIIVVGLEENNKIKWIKSTSYAKGMNNQLLHEKISMSTGIFNTELVDKHLDLVENYFVRLSSSEIEYIKDSVNYSLLDYLILFLFSIMVSSVSCGIFYKIKHQY